MKKRIISLLLALVLIFGAAFSINASAASKVLRFDENGEFKIMHLTDCQDVYPANETMLKFIDASIKEYRPDLVVLGGDNVVAKNNMENGIRQIVEILVANETYFTLVFGNHDFQQDLTDDEQLAVYQKYGGEYCLAYDPHPELHGTATHALPILGSNSNETKFMLYMFDSGDYVKDENGKELGLGYECVDEKQIEWYENTSKAVEAANGKKVPAFAFQHIVVGDVYDALFRETDVDLGVLTPTYNGKRYSFLPKTENIEDGFLFEFPCPGYYNFGQFDAMVERGDVIGIFSGHDHPNTYVTELDGIKIVNSGGATYHSYGSDMTRGMRMITLNEDDLSTFETEQVTINQFALDNPDFAEDAGISLFEAAIVTAFGDFLLAMGKFSGVFSRLISLIFN